MAGPICALLAPALLAAGAANAGALGVAPLGFELSSAHPIRTLEITNPSDQPVQVQLRLFAWAGGGVDEHYTPSQDVGFSPPMFELAPGARQVVRIAARTAAPQETSYRLFVDQLAPPRDGGGISMPVRMALPVFIEPDAIQPAHVDWRFGADHDGPYLTARNRGGQRLRLMDLTLKTAQGQVTVAPGLSGYVLAGQERTWRLKATVGPKPASVHAETDHGPLDAEATPD